MHLWTGRRKASGRYIDSNEVLEVDDDWTLNSIPQVPKWRGTVRLEYYRPKITFEDASVEPTSVWVRCDKCPSVLRTTLKEGPKWDCVTRRISVIVNPAKAEPCCNVIEDLQDAGDVTDAATLYKRIDA